MARVSSSHHLEELVREARVLSSIKADIPNAWKILEDEINRAKAAMAHTVDQPATSVNRTPSPELSRVNTISAPSPGSSVDPSAKSPSNVTASEPTGATPTVSLPDSSPPSEITLASSSLPSSSSAPASSAAATAAAVAAVNAFADASHPPPAAAPRHPVRKRVKLRVPAEQYPDYNFVGRLLGPRGATLKRLERDTACRIMIRGKGSIRKDKEAEVRGKPGYEHVFHEPLHVVIEVADATDDASAGRTLARAKELVEMLLVPVPEERDSLKRAQLRDLAILNGTHRSVSDLLGPSPSTLHHHLSSLGGNNPARSPPLASSPPPLRRAHSTLATPTAPMYNPSDAFAAAFDQTSSFGRLSGNPSAHSGPSLPSGGFGAPQAPSGYSSNPAVSADSFLPDLSKLRIPSLDLDTLNEPSLSSPLPMPAASPTLVDPDFYPYPPTPGVLSVEQNALNAFASPMWSTRNTSVSTGISSGALPPRSPPPPSGLPPRSPPPNNSGNLDGSGFGTSGHSGNGAHASTSLLMSRQFSDHPGRAFIPRDLHQRDSPFDLSLNNGHLSSGQLDDELGSLVSQLPRSSNERVGRSAVGSPPPSSPPSLSRARSLGPHHLSSRAHHGSMLLQRDQKQEDQNQEIQTKQLKSHVHLNEQHQHFANSESIILSNLFPLSSPSQSHGDGSGEHVSLRFHPGHGNSVPLTSTAPSSSTCQ